MKSARQAAAVALLGVAVAVLGNLLTDTIVVNVRWRALLAGTLVASAALLAWLEYLRERDTDTGPLVRAAALLKGSAAPEPAPPRRSPAAATRTGRRRKPSRRARWAVGILLGVPLIAVGVVVQAERHPQNDSPSDPTSSTTPTPTPTPAWSVPGSTGQNVLSSDGNTVVAVTGTTMSAYDARTGQVRWSLRDIGPIGQLAVSGNGKTVIVYPLDGQSAPVFDGSTGKVDGRLPLQSVSLMRFAPDGVHLAVVFTDAGSDGPEHVQVWDVAARRVQAQWTTQDAIHDAAFSPDSADLAVAQCGSPVQEWHLRPLRPWPALTTPLTAESIECQYQVAFSPDGRRLLADVDVGRYRQRTYLWDLTDRDQIPQPITDLGSLGPFVFTNDCLIADARDQDTDADNGVMVVRYHGLTAESPAWPAALKFGSAGTSGALLGLSGDALVEINGSGEAMVVYRRHRPC